MATILPAAIINPYDPSLTVQRIDLTVSGVVNPGDLTFSGATAFGALADGTYNSGITSTACCQGIAVEADTFGSGGVTLPLDLTNGTHTLYLETSDWTAGYGLTVGGINLFFDSNATPGISVHTNVTYDKTVFNGFTVTANTVGTAGLGNSGVPGSGSLTYTNGTASVTITQAQWVGGVAPDPPSVPEPSSLLLLAGGVLVFIGKFKRA